MTSLSFTKDTLYNFPENCFINKLSTYSQSNCTAAFSLRLIRNNYTGPMINVRRSSDNSTLDFYGDVNDSLGTVIHGKGQSLNDWLNGSTGFLTKWYDQSGNSGRDLLQTTFSQQPVINSANNTITYDGTKLLFNTTNTPLTSGLDTYTYICNFTSTNFSTSRTIFEISPSPLTNFNRAALLQNLSSYGFSGFNCDAFVINNNTSTNRKCVMMCNHNLSTGNIVINDNATIYSATTTIAPSNLSVNPTTFVVGRNPVGSEFFIGDINEIIIFKNTLTTRESELYFIPNIITKKNYSNFPKIQLKGVPKDNEPIPSGLRFGFDSQSFSNLTSGNTISSIGSYNSDSNFTAQTTISPFNNPIYRNISGTTTNALTQAPYVEFTRASSMYLNGGSRILNIATNGGFTAVVYCAFTGAIGNWERIFDFANGAPSDNLVFSRNGNSANLIFNIYNAGNIACSIATTNNCIIQNEWAVYTCRYTLSTNFVEILKNGILQISGTGNSVTNKTLTNTYTGRSNFSGDSFSSINITGLYMYDRYLTDIQLSSVSNHLVYSTTRDIPNVIPDYTKIFKVGNVQTIGYRQDQAMFFNGNINSFIDIQDVPALPLTFSFWFNSTNTSNNNIVGLCDFNRGTNFGIQCDISSGNLIVYAALPSTWTTSTAYSITTGIWYHITIVVNLSFQVLVYINGTLYQTLTGTTIPPARSRFIIGAGGDASKGYNGYLYDFRVYDYSLRSNEISDIYDSRDKLQLTYTSPSNYLVNVINWYNTMTLYTSGSFTATATINDPNVQYQLLNGTLNNYNTFYNQTPIQNYTSFTCSFEFYTSNAIADELFFFCGANTTVLNGTNGKGQLNSYGINLQVLNSNTPGVYLYDNSSTPVSYSGVTHWKNLAMWVPITITYTRGSINTWVINISGSDIITYSDSNNSNWLTTAGNYWGIGARCGGSSMNAFIRRVELTYIPYTSGLVNTLNASLKTFPTAAMTSNTTVLTDGTYIASASNTASGSPFNVFNNTFKTLNTTWYPGQLYNITTGIYTGSVTTTVSGTSQLGEWIQIQFPKAIVINSYGLSTYWKDGNYKPRSFILAGSNDATTWVSLSDIPSKTNWVYGNEEVFNVETTLAYSYYRIIFRRSGISDSGSNQDYIIIDSFRLFSNQNTNKLPITSLTSNNTNLPGNTLGNGTYITSASTENSGVYLSYRAFINSYNDNIGWASNNNLYNTTTGVYTGSVSTLVSNISYTGEFLQIQLPNSIQLASFNILPRQDNNLYLRSPVSFILAGSNNSVTWDLIHTGNTSWASVLEQTFIVNAGNSNKYNYFRIILRIIGTSSDGWGGFQNLSLFAGISIGSSVASRGLIDGLTWKSYNGYHSDSLTFTQTNTYNNIGTSIDFTTLRTETNGQFFNGLGQNLFTIEWFGYFRANTTGLWTFTIVTTDDSSYIWIGNTALTGNTTTNPIAKQTSRSGTIYLISGVYYPIRILYGESVAGEEFSMTFTPPGGVPTYNGNGYFFSSTGLNSAYPAESAKIIKDLTGINTDGTYYINVNGTSTATYCLMNDMYDGGGWMMLLKATTGTTFQYSANYWSTTNTLNPNDTTRNNADAKYNVFNYNTIKDVMAIWPDINPDAYQNVYGKIGGCFYVKDGWIWKVDNWNGNSRTTALAGFQNTRFPAGGTGSITQPIGMNNPFQYSGFSNTLFSYQTGAYLHYFNADNNFLYKARWGFVFNNETNNFTTSDAIAGIGLLASGNNYSAGDYYSAAGVSNLNRQARIEMYGR